jgi:cytochrome b561
MTDRYPRAMRWLHWSVAGLVIAVLSVGLVLGYGLVSGKSPAGQTLEDLHILFGVLVALVTVVRIYVRARSTIPPVVGSALERATAMLAHGLLYALVIGLPVIGYAMKLSYGRAPAPFGLAMSDFGLTRPGVRYEAIGEFLWLLHSYGGKLLAVLVIIHVAAVVRRTIRDRSTGSGDGLWRMLPADWRSRPAR